MSDIRAKLAESLQDVTTLPRDAAAVALAEVYALLIDQALDEYALAAVEKLGPRLLQVLKELQMTPAARGATSKEPPSAPVASALDELRERRRSRENRAAAVDAAAAPADA